MLQTTIQPYDGLEIIQVGNGSGLVIHNTGFSYINITHDSFYLNKFSHCPKAATNLLSINQFFLNNNCYFIMTETNFYVKKNKTR